MCGIYFSCNRTHNEDPPETLKERLGCRGPDASQVIKFGPHGDHGFLAEWHITAMSTVLSLRGDMPVVQPVTSGSGITMACSFLMWNGEAWKYDGEVLHSHDSSFVYQRLMEATMLHSANPEAPRSCKIETIQAVANVFSRISGPYAFVLFDWVHDLLFYGRDVLGRRSLLIRKSGDEGFELTSVCAGLGNFEEVSADGLYYVDLSPPTKHDRPGPQVVHVPWQKNGQPNGVVSSLVSKAINLQTSLTSSSDILSHH